MALVSKSLSYRRCEANAPIGTNFSLQNALENASKTNKMPWLRPLGGQTSQFLMHLVHKQNCLCGTLALSANNKKIALCDANSDGTTWEGQTDPKDATGKLRKLEEGNFFFAIRENHVAMLACKEINIEDFLKFLIWFIHSEGKISINVSFDLVNIPSTEALEKLQNQTIKGFSFGKSAFKVTTEKEDIPGKKRQKVTKHIKVDSTVMHWLKAIGLEEEIISKMEKSSDPGSIYMSMQISYKSRTKKDSQEMMHALANTIGTIEELDTNIQLSNKTSIKGNELTIRDSVKLNISDGIISKEEAMTALAMWLTGAIDSRKVYL